MRLINPLPIDPHLPRILASLTKNRSLIIKAEPGAGKTTRVPAYLMNALPGRIIVLEPRRLAARLSAERVAQELGKDIGNEVGYQVRFDAKSSAQTRLFFVTEGVFMRQVLSSPTLAGVTAVVIDEFHERHIHTDIALALVRRLQNGPRPDLNLVIMSATLDGANLQAYLPDAEMFDIPGRTFPVSIEYLPFAGQIPVEQAVVSGLRRLLADPRCPGNILVFLTGIQEIRATEAHLQNLASEAGIEIVALAADLPGGEQARAFAMSGKRRVILSTNVAETSLTLPDITGVIDTGRAKIAGHASWSGMPTLDVKKISQASCIQRAGRAGRVAPGVAYRLFSEADFGARPKNSIPDIRRLDLAETCLELAALAGRNSAPGQASNPWSLPWFEPPEVKAKESAESLLRRLGALDAHCQLTEVGSDMARIALHPRLAAIVASGLRRNCADIALAAACLLSERMVLGRNLAARVHETSDVHFQLGLLCTFMTPLRRRNGQTSLLQHLDRGRADRVFALYKQLAGSLGVGPFPRDPGDEDLLAKCLLAGFPDRVAKRRELKTQKRPLYNLCLGRGAVLAEGSVVHDVDLLLALDASEASSRTQDQGTVIYVAARITPDHLLEAPGDLLSESTLPIWVDEAERVDFVTRVTYGELTITETRTRMGEKEITEAHTLLAKQLAERWPKPFSDASDLASYHVRADLLEQAGLASGLPRFEGEMLELLQIAIAEGKRSFKEIAAKRLLDYILNELPYELADLISKKIPLEIELKNGKRCHVTYEAARPPFIQGYIQDFFGIQESPTLPTNMPLTLQLLGPNKRPVQVTGDLPGFWQRSYPSLRSELSRVYPRHFWPESPTEALPQLHKQKRPRP